ncbi:hypothetical protein N9S30_00260 [bacterium]|nr:hypothetical protein [bacterium]
MDLPPNVRLYNEKTGKYHLKFTRGGKVYQMYSKDVAVLVAWRAEIDAKLDAEGVAKTKVVTKAAKQSSTPGVLWHANRSRWRGECYDKLVRKSAVTLPFADEADAVAAFKVLREKLEAKFEAEMTRRYAVAAQTTPNLAGLLRAPASWSDADAETVYWHVTKQGDYQPYRAVRTTGGYKPACADCHQLALPNALGEKPTHCMQHGGGGSRYCTHDRQRSKCRECNPVGKITTAACSNCFAGLYDKRRTTNGGNGICATCEIHFKAQATENGTAPPEKSKRWEDVVFDRLLPQIVDTDGDVVSPELRDDFSNVLGSLYEEKIDGGGRKLRKRKRGKEDCDTTTYRRPDSLFVRRDPTTGHIVAVLSVEVDEDCHDTRKFKCETGKVEDTFQAIQRIAGGEGASAASRTGVRADAECVYYTVFKFNPNACDAKPSVKLDDRIKVLARACCAFLSRDPEEYKAMPIEERAVPHVTTFYYHSKAMSLDVPGGGSEQDLSGRVPQARSELGVARERGLAGLKILGVEGGPPPASTLPGMESLGRETKQPQTWQRMECE